MATSFVSDEVVLQQIRFLEGRLKTFFGNSESGETFCTVDNDSTEANPIYMIGIAGLPGAGKTTLSLKLAETISKETPFKACAIPMDGYHFYKHQLDKFENPEEAHFRRGAPFTFDSARMLKDLTALKLRKIDEEHSFPGFSHEEGDPFEGAIVVKPEVKCVFVEGNYLLLNRGPQPWPQFRTLFNETWYLKVDIEEAIRRTTERNAKAFGWTIEKTLERVRASDQLNMEAVIDSEPEKFANVVILNS